MKLKPTWIILTIVAIILGIFFLCHTSSDARAIEKVLEQDSFTTINLPNNNPREAYNIIVSRMRAINTINCPTDFRYAYERHIHAWEGLRNQIMSEPDGFMESFLSGFIHGLSGDLTGGLADMEAARKYWSSEIEATFNEVQAIAIKYGADVN